jgi:type IV pilus assembly protein PilM
MVTGLDIGSFAIKAMQIKNTGSERVLVNMALAEIPQAVQEETDPDTKQDQLLEIIKNFLHEHDFHAKDVLTSISGDEAIVRYVKLPFMSEDELKNVIHYEVEQYIPLSIDQVVLDFAVLGELEEEGQKKLEVLLVAAKEEIVDRHVTLLNRAGLSPRVIDVDSFALANAFEFNHGKPEGETIGLVHIGAKLTTINILENGVSHLTRDVPVAGNSFTREIMREFNLSFDEAETLKRQQGQVQLESEDILRVEAGDKENKSARIGEAVNPVLNKLLAEIRRSFDYYESSIRKHPIGRIVLSGGTARLKNLDRYLGEKLNLPVETDEPLKQLKISDKKFDTEFVKDNAQHFNICLGLVLRGTGA